MMNAAWSFFSAGNALPADEVGGKKRHYKGAILKGLLLLCIKRGGGAWAKPLTG